MSQFKALLFIYLWHTKPNTVTVPLTQSRMWGLHPELPSEVSWHLLFAWLEPSLLSSTCTLSSGRPPPTPLPEVGPIVPTVPQLNTLLASFIALTPICHWSIHLFNSFPSVFFQWAIAPKGQRLCLSCLSCSSHLLSIQYNSHLLNKWTDLNLDIVQCWG